MTRAPANPAGARVIAATIGQPDHQFFVYPRDSSRETLVRGRNQSGGCLIHTFFSRDAGRHDALPRDEIANGSGDGLARFVDSRGDEPVDAFGIPQRVHFFAVAVFAFAVGFVPLLFAFTPGGEELRNPVVVGICLSGIAIAPLLMLLARRWRYREIEWAFQAILFFAIAGALTCQLVIDETRAPFLTLLMVGPIGAAYYFPIRRALPMIVLGTGAIFFASARSGEPDAVLRGFVIATVTAACSMMLSTTKRQHAEMVESNREISERDALTGAYNLHKFDERLREEIARSQRDGSEFVLIEFDLDEFKQVNDSYNHTVGDNVLVATAEAILSVLTPADLLVRRGGDEFAVIAPSAPWRDPATLVERARLQIAHARSELCPDLTPTACGDWVAYRRGETAESMLHRADEALRYAKQLAKSQSGVGIARNVVRIASSRRPDRPSDQVSELRANRANAAQIGDDPISGAMRIAWRAAALATTFLSIVIVVMSLNGWTSFELSTPVLGLLVVWNLVMTPFAIWASVRASQPMWLTYVLSFSSLALITLGCVAVGRSAPVAVDLYLMAIVIYMTLLPIRPAASFSVAAFGLYAFFLVQSDYRLADMRITTTIVNFSLICAVIAITRHRTIEAASEKAQLARTDALTGLPNMRRLRDRLRYEIRRCETTGASLAMLMLDLDEFKTVNDLLSLSAGDKVLIAVAEALERTARQADMPARRGGDEFVVVLTDADEEDARIAADRAGDAIRRARLRVVPETNPDASIGWVVWRSGESVDMLIDRADSALREAKIAGRQRRVYSM